MPIDPEVFARLKGRGTRGKSPKDLADRQNAAPEESPFASVVYTDDLEADALAELDALMARFERADTTDEQIYEVTDSRHYATLVFLHRDDKETFLLKTGIFEEYDKYADGAFVIRRFDHVKANGPVQYKQKERYDPRPEWQAMVDRGELTEKQMAFRLADWKVNHDMDMLGGSEYWMAVCFHTDAELQAFLADYPPLEGTKYLDGYAVADQIGIEIPKE